MTDPGDREHIAARYLIETSAPTFSDEQREELAHWLKADLENCRVFLKLVHAWRRTALLRYNALPIPYGRPSMAEKLDMAERKRVLTAAENPALANKALGQVLKDYRRARQWSQGMLASRAHLTESYISKMERGQVSPSLATIVGLAQALGLMPSAFLLDFEQVLRAMTKDSRPR